MRKIILSLILLFNVFCVFAETGYNGLYWGMPEDKAYWKMDFLKPLTFPDESIKIYTENKTKEKYVFIDNSFYFVIRNIKSKKENPLSIKNVSKFQIEIEREKIYKNFYDEYKKSTNRDFFEDFEKLDVLHIKNFDYIIMLITALNIFPVEYNTSETENLCGLELYKHNDDTLSIIIKNYYENDIELLIGSSLFQE